MSDDLGISHLGRVDFDVDVLEVVVLASIGGQAEIRSPFVDNRISSQKRTSLNQIPLPTILRRLAPYSRLDC